MTAGRIDVVEVYEIASDLDYSVGNIAFSGDVIVRGDVKPGFEIVAGGSVTVRGITEGATIKAQRDITVAGVIGGSVLEAGGDIVAQYFNNARVTASGQVTVNREIINATVEAQRVVTAPAGRIVGGSVTAHKEVDAGTLGSHEAVTTEITVDAPAHDDSAVVRARRVAYPGVIVRVSIALLLTSDELPGVSFWNVAGRIVRLGAGAGHGEAAQSAEASAA